MFQGASTSYGVEPNNILCALLVKLKLRPLGEPPSKWLGEHDRCVSGDQIITILIPLGFTNAMSTITSMQVPITQFSPLPYRKVRLRRWARNTNWMFRFRRRMVPATAPRYVQKSSYIIRYIFINPKPTLLSLKPTLCTTINDCGFKCMPSIYNVADFKFIYVDFGYSCLMVCVMAHHGSRNLRVHKSWTRLKRLWRPNPTNVGWSNRDIQSRSRIHILFG